jgi:hypothetical protein
VEEDSMKSLAISMLLAAGLAAPAFAQEPPAPAAKPAPADSAFNPLHELDSLSVLTDEAIAPLDRIKMLARCGGPPPKPVPVASAPRSEPAAVAEAAAATPSPTG